MNQITALRGLAIIFIVLFHLAPKAFPYGYYGVEVFLVISGFLLMHSYLRRGCQINLPEFAGKKLLRLFLPTSCIVLLTVSIGLVMLDSNEILQACSAGLHTMIGNANTHLAQVQGDYFAPDSSTNPFLHMWYLAVIIHVYILFAVGCLLARVLPRKVMVALLWLVGIVSLCWAYSYHFHEMLLKRGLPVWSQEHPVSHYMTMPRLWEPLAGMLLAVLMNRAVSQPLVVTPRRSAIETFLAVLGLACILWLSFSHGKTAARGAVVVVLGTCLVIRYGGGTWLRWFCNPVLLWVGGISFSLYLVHMPMIALFHSCFLRAPEWYEMLLIGAISVLAAWLFCIGVEKRPARWFVMVPVYVSAVLLCVAGVCTDGFRDYIHVEANKIKPPQYLGWEVSPSSDLYRGLDRDMMLPCTALYVRHVSKVEKDAKMNPYLMGIGVPSKDVSFVLMGDSHAGAAYPGLNETCKNMGISGVCVTTYVLPYWDRELPPFEFNKTYFYSRAKAEALLSWLRQHPEIKNVIFSNNFSDQLGIVWSDWDMKRVERSDENYAAALRVFVSKLKALGKNVIFLAPVLHVRQPDVARFVRSKKVGKPVGDMKSITCSREEYMQQHGKVLSIMDALETEGLCKVWRVLDYIPEDKPFCAYEGGELLYIDEDHMSAAGAIRLFRWLQPQMENTLKPAVDAP